jgi:hypothetical protein
MDESVGGASFYCPGPWLWDYRCTAAWASTSRRFCPQRRPPSHGVHEGTDLRIRHQEPGTVSILARNVEFMEKRSTAMEARKAGMAKRLSCSAP